MKKSTINANKIVRSFRERVVDFDRSNHSSKKIQECYIVKNNALTEGRASFLVQREEEKHNQNRLIYNLNSYTQLRNNLFEKDKDDLLVYTSTSDFENSI